MTPPPLVDGGLHLKGEKMNDNDIKPGYVYHIKDYYFETVKDDKLMRNHESGAYRPTYFCLKDVKTGLLWVIPMSSRIDKYQVIIDRDNNYRIALRRNVNRNAYIIFNRNDSFYKGLQHFCRVVFRSCEYIGFRNPIYHSLLFRSG